MNSLPKWLKEITYVMEHVDADVRGIEENLQHALKTEETGPNLANEIKSVRSALEAIADRTIIFAWIYIPVGTISLGIVLARNIL